MFDFFDPSEADIDITVELNLSYDDNADIVRDYETSRELGHRIRIHTIGEDVISMPRSMAYPHETEYRVAPRQLNAGKAVYMTPQTVVMTEIGGSALVDDLIPALLKHLGIDAYKGISNRVKSAISCNASIYPHEFCIDGKKLISVTGTGGRVGHRGYTKLGFQLDDSYRKLLPESERDLTITFEEAAGRYVSIEEIVEFVNERYS